MNCDICHIPVFGGLCRHPECINNQSLVNLAFQDLGGVVVVNGRCLVGSLAHNYLSSMPSADFDSLLADLALLDGETLKN